MSFANDNMLRTSEPRFLAPADGNYAAGRLRASILRALTLGKMPR